MANKMVIGWPSWTSKATFSGGAAAAGYPVTNLGALPLSRVWRTPDLLSASTQFIATFDKPRGIRAFGLVRHNLSLDAQVRYTVYADAAMRTALNTPAWEDLWPTVYPLQTLEWEDDNWFNGKYRVEELEGAIWTRPFWLNQLYLAAAIKIEVSDPTNAAGYVEIGMCELAQGWQVSVNPDYGLSYGFRFRTVMQEAIGGRKVFERRYKPRTDKGQIPYLPRDEALARGFEALRQADIDLPFLYFPYPDETTHWLRTAYLARFIDPSPLTRAFFGRDSFPFSCEEVLD